MVINLDRDADRLAHMTAALGAVDLPFVRLPGVLGRDIPDRLTPYFAPDCPLRAGEVGCYESHLLALMDVAEGRHGEAAIIMEDDLEISPDFPQVVRDLMTTLPAAWDMVRLSNEPKRAVIPVAALGATRTLIRYSRVPNGAGAYLVSRVGARKLLEVWPRSRALDEDLRRPWNFDLDVFGVAPPPVEPDRLTSTIDAMEAGRLDGRGTFLRRLRRTAWREFPRRQIFNARTLGLSTWLTCIAWNAIDRCRPRRRFPRSNSVP